MYRVPDSITGPIEKAIWTAVACIIMFGFFWILQTNVPPH